MIKLLLSGFNDVNLPLYISLMVFSKRAYFILQLLELFFAKDLSPMTFNLIAVDGRESKFLLQSLCDCGWRGCDVAVHLLWLLRGLRLRHKRLDTIDSSTVEVTGVGVGASRVQWLSVLNSVSKEFQACKRFGVQKHTLQQ